MTTGKTTALTRRTFVDKVMSLLFNMLSRLVIAFLPRSKCLLFHGCSHHSCSDFGAQENSLSLFPLFPHLFVMKWWDQIPGSFSSTLAWKISWTEEPGRLQSMGSLKVGQDWATSLSLFTSMHWRKKWQPTPVFLPGESQGWWSLMGCHLWGHTESDTTEAT